MVWGEQPFTFDRVVRLALGAVALGGLIWLLGYLSDVLIPFAVALLLAYLLNPLVGLIQRWVRSRPAAVALSLLVVAGAVTGLGWLIIPLVVAQATHLGQVLSDLVTSSDLARQAAERLPPDLWGWLKGLAARPDIRELFQADGLRNLAEAGLKRLLPGLWSVLSGAMSLLLGLLGLLVVGLYLVFLLLDLPSVSATWPRLIPARHREKVLAFAAEANLAMSRYFRAQAFIAAIVGAIYALGFTVLGLPLGVLLGLFMAVLNMVPYLEIVGLIPACLLAGVQALETGSSFWLALGKVGIVFALSQAAQGLVLTPRIMGQATGLSPALILLSLSVWGKLLGFLGLIIALPLTCLVWAWYQRLFCNPPERVE